ncbi:MAG: hypothetical protein IJM31_06480, partial [Campylobacter sp.]|nr:hypothetical protein [Campylobacter sp.]
MKKLLYLLPFIILNFCFSIGISYMEYDLTSRNHTLIENNAVLWVDKYKNGSEFCAYTLKSENLKQSSIGFNG